MISQQTSTVWYAPTRGRRYLSKKAAINAEAKAIIYAKYPPEPYEHDTGHSYNIDIDEPERYLKMHRRISLKLKNTMVIQ